MIVAPSHNQIGDLTLPLTWSAQEAESVASVRAQLAAFRREMEADGTAQRAECRRLVATAVRRAKELVDNVLQVRRAVHLVATPCEPWLLGA